MGHYTLSSPRVRAEVHAGESTYEMYDDQGIAPMEAELEAFITDVETRLSEAGFYSLMSPPKEWQRRLREAIGYDARGERVIVMAEVDNRERWE